MAAATYYSYDIHGNVDKLLQDYHDATQGMAGNNSRFKLMTYEYDLISGKVNKVNYQPGFADAFYHRYGYDAENRITEVSTSRDGIYWERDAHYEYYRHGPLMRTELGQLRVQGTDYTYTLQGWLKGVNQTSLNPLQDGGADGAANSVVARDVLSYGLHYYDETIGTTSYRDYKAIGGTDPIARPGLSSNFLPPSVIALIFAVISAKIFAAVRFSTHGVLRFDNHSVIQFFLPALIIAIIYALVLANMFAAVRPACRQRQVFNPRRSPL